MARTKQLRLTNKRVFSFEIVNRRCLSECESKTCNSKVVHSKGKLKKTNFGFVKNKNQNLTISKKYNLVSAFLNRVRGES